MFLHTFNQDQQLIQGVASQKVYLGPDKPVYKVSTGSYHPLGTIDHCHFAATSNAYVKYDNEGILRLFQIGSKLGEHLLLIENQAPRSGSWELSMSNSVTIFCSGYVPEIRGLQHGAGQEIMLSMPVGSHVKIRRRGRLHGSPKHILLLAYDMFLDMKLLDQDQEQQNLDLRL